MEISKSLDQVRSAQDDKQCWEKIEWLIDYLYLILSLAMPYYQEGCNIG